jgi:hypothetical protein
MKSLTLPPVNSKLKLSLCMSRKKGGGGIAVLILGSGSQRKWVISVTTRPLYPRGRHTVPTVHIVQEAGSASTPVWMNPENLARTGVRAPDHPGRSELLCRLHYPDPSCEVLMINSVCYAVSLKISRKRYSLSQQES